MSILSDFEDRIGGAIEGFFAEAFRSPVQPVEIARVLAREMDDNRVVGVGRVHVPSTYVVSLSEEDLEKLAAFADVLAGELSTYLVSHTRERSYHLSSRPTVSIVSCSDLKLGRFSVAVDPSVVTTAPGDSGPALATITVGGTHHDIVLAGERMIVGRLAECAIWLDDANTSRRHAAFVSEDDGWAVEDLGSTNGVKVNGEPITRQTLSDGDVITIGITRLVFHRSRE